MALCNKPILLGITLVIFAFSFSINSPELQNSIMACNVSNPFIQGLRGRKRRCLRFSKVRIGYFCFHVQVLEFGACASIFTDNAWSHTRESFEIVINSKVRSWVVHKLCPGLAQEVRKSKNSFCDLWNGFLEYVQYANRGNSKMWLKAHNGVPFLA